MTSPLLLDFMCTFTNWYTSINFPKNVNQWIESHGSVHLPKISKIARIAIKIFFFFSIL